MHAADPALCVYGACGEQNAARYANAKDSIFAGGAAAKSTASAGSVAALAPSQRAPSRCIHANDPASCKYGACGVRNNRADAASPPKATPLAVADGTLLAKRAPPPVSRSAAASDDPGVVNAKCIHANDPNACKYGACADNRQGSSVVSTAPPKQQAATSRSSPTAVPSKRTDGADSPATIASPAAPTTPAAPEAAPTKTSMCMHANDPTTCKYGKCAAAREEAAAFEKMVQEELMKLKQARNGGGASDAPTKSEAPATNATAADAPAKEASLAPAAPIKLSLTPKAAVPKAVVGQSAIVSEQGDAEDGAGSTNASPAPKSSSSRTTSPVSSPTALLSDASTSSPASSPPRPMKVASPTPVPASTAVNAAPAHPAAALSASAPRRSIRKVVKTLGKSPSPSPQKPPQVQTPSRRPDATASNSTPQRKMNTLEVTPQRRGNSTDTEKTPQRKGGTANLHTTPKRQGTSTDDVEGTPSPNPQERKVKKITKKIHRKRLEFKSPVRSGALATVPQTVKSALQVSNGGSVLAPKQPTQSNI